MIARNSPRQTRAAVQDSYQRLYDRMTCRAPYPVSNSMQNRDPRLPAGGAPDFAMQRQLAIAILAASRLEPRDRGSVVSDARSEAGVRTTGEPHWSPRWMQQTGVRFSPRTTPICVTGLCGQRAFDGGWLSRDDPCHHNAPVDGLEPTPQLRRRLLTSATVRRLRRRQHSHEAR